MSNIIELTPGNLYIFDKHYYFFAKKQICSDPYYDSKNHCFIYKSIYVSLDCVLLYIGLFLGKKYIFYAKKNLILLDSFQKFKAL